jgi:GNAT superfamily N-acetyltransferase
MFGETTPVTAAGPPIRIAPLEPSETERVASVLGLARLEQGNGFYLVAWEGEEPLGHAHLALTDPPELQDVSVRDEHRRRGIASALTEAAEHEAAARGFDRLRLEVSIRSDAAQALYRKAGYSECGVPPRRVQGTVMIRTGPLEVDDTLLTWEKRFYQPGASKPGSAASPSRQSAR